MPFVLKVPGKIVEENLDVLLIEIFTCVEDAPDSFAKILELYLVA